MRQRLGAMAATAATSLLISISVLISPGPAHALSCVGPPSVEATITGQVEEEFGWDPATPGVIGTVSVGTALPARGEAEPGQRLAVVDVIAGIRMDTVPGQVSVIMGPTTGWGHPSYNVGDIVFLRSFDDVFEDPHPDGPCSVTVFLTPGEPERLIALAEEVGTNVALPVAESEEADEADQEEEETTSTTTADVAPTEPSEEATPPQLPEAQLPQATTENSTPWFPIALAAAGAAAFALAGAGAFTYRRRATR